jgi:hypothetical protein
MQVHQIATTPNSTVTVVEIDDRLTPRGLALEFHLVTSDTQTWAFWLLEDARFLQASAIGRA